MSALIGLKMVDRQKYDVYEVAQALNRDLAGHGVRIHTLEELTELQDEGWIHDYAIGEALPADIAETIARIRATTLRQADGTHGESAGPHGWSYGIEGDPSWDALCEIRAWQASCREDVRDFRHRHLGGVLIALDEVSDWIASRARAEEEDLLFSVALPLSSYRETLNSPDESLGDMIGGMLRKGAAQIVPNSREAILLMVPSGSRDAYFISDSRINAGVVHAKCTGITGEIKTLCGVLNDVYGWHEALAVAFLLTGITPRPWPFAAHWTRRDSDARRIVLEMSSTMRLKEVGAAVARIRRKAAGTSRARPLTLAKAKILEFAVRLMRSSPDHDWSYCVERWNEENPEVLFESAEAFSRAVRDGYRKLAGENWPTE